MNKPKNKQELNHSLPHNHFLSGSEQFTFKNKEIGHSLLDYWSWSFSDIYNNIYRGIMAEYIVATALGITPPQGTFIRTVWNSYDLLSPGGRRVEVKSAAYLQSQDGEPSKIIYDIAPARTYDNNTHKYSSKLQRNNDVYVFCLFTALSRDISPLDLNYWDFYVLPTRVFDEKKPDQKTITWNSLQKLNPIFCKFDTLGETIENC